MKELSLNILDITKNSVTAGAKNIEISLIEDEKDILTLSIKDDGCGMSEETLNKVSNPFDTTRTTRKVGMGIPLLTLAAEQTGGKVTIVSSTKSENHGTTISATFDTTSIDFTPLGDIVETVCLLIQGNPEIDFVFIHKTPKLNVRLSIPEIKEILGEDVSVAEFEVIQWIKGFLDEQYNDAQ